MRGLRVLIRHLPPDNAASRAHRGEWGDPERLLWDIDSRLRDLIALTFNANRGENTSPASPDYLPVPGDRDAEQDRQRAQAQAVDAEEAAAIRKSLARLMLGSGPEWEVTRGR